MRPLSFRSDSLRKLLLRNKIATLADLKRALGTDVDLTVFRKLKELDYLTSYSHRGRFYTFARSPVSTSRWPVVLPAGWFSRYGTLLATAEAFVHRSPRGYFAEELPVLLHVGVQDAHANLSSKQSDSPVGLRPVPLYFHRSSHPATAILTRRNQSVPTVVDASVWRSPMR